MFYVAARGVGADILSALVFILLFAVTGDQSIIWYLIFSPAETFGMFLTAVAVWALVRAAARAEPSPTTRETFDGAGVLTFSGTLQPGRNELRLVVLDTASAHRRPNGVPLLVLLRRMTVGAPPRPLRNGVASGELDGRRPGRQPGH